MSRRSASRSAAAKTVASPSVSGFPCDSLEREIRASLVPNAESHYQSLFDGVPVGLYRTTMAGQIVDVNPVLVETLGYPDRATLLAANAADLYVDPEDRRRAVEMLQRDGVLRDFEMRMLRHDGTTIWMRDNVRAICDEQGNPLFFLGSLEDISHRKQAAEEAVGSLAKLHLAMVGTIEAMAAISEMRDPHTAGHQRRVAKLAVAIATRLGLERALREVTTHRGRYYDEEVVDACQAVVASGFEFEEPARHSRPPPRSAGP